MNEYREENYSFCPVCGALMENGICLECMKKKERMGVYSSEYYSQQPSQMQYQYQQRVYQRQREQYNPYMQPPQKDNKVWVIVGIVAAIVVLIATIVGSFFYGYFLMKFAEEDTDFFDEEYDFIEDEYEDYEDDYFGEHPDNDESLIPDEEYVPSPEDTYYYGPCDSINKEVDYTFVSKTYTNEDPENDIDIVINYIELKGESIPNIDKLNEALENAALYYAMEFPKESYYAEIGESYAAYITSYVTYNDDDMISIVLDEYVIADGEYHVDLYPLNIDIKNGVILENNSIVQIDEEFAKEFRKRNNEQNGNIEYLDSLSDEELVQWLQDENYVIAYYTPLGMEIGLNYSEEGSSGWFTVTYKDYEEYLTKF